MNTITRIIAALLLLISIEGFGQVSVTATAGTLTGSYTTLNAAFAAIDAGTHQGAINISITGNTTEPSPPTSLVGSGVGSASYTSINISPSGGSWTVNSAALPFAYRGIIELFGAQHVTIDGDPTGTGTRHLTFEVAMTSDIYTSAIRMGSTDTSGLTGAAYDTIRNCNIIGGRDSANSSVPSYCVVVSGSNTTSISAAYAYGCNYDAFINNTFVRSYRGLSLLGSGQTGNNNILIRKNRFGSDSTSTSNIYCIEIEDFSVSGLDIIDSNDFTGNLNDFTFYGIFNSSAGAMSVNNNNIHDITSQGQIYGYYSISIASLSLYNNVMQNCTGSNNTCFLYAVSNGVLSNTYGKWDVYNNTMSNLSVTGYATLAGIVFNSSMTDTIYCHDNIITNLTGASNVLGVGYSWTEKAFFYNNIISGLTTTNSGNFACGMFVTGVVYNNMISNISANPGSTTPMGSNPAFTNYTSLVPSSAIGMTGYGDIYANTVALNTANQVGTVANAFSTAFYFFDAQTNFHNNIFYNSQISSNAFAFYAGAVSTSHFSSDSIDYNEYYAPYGEIGYATSAQATLLDWQAATGFDMHSVSGPVPFISTSNLHIDTLNSAANNVFRNGTYIASVPADIDGQTRNNPPCIGADEFYSVTALPDSIVWPGDADNNLVVNNLDLLPIGMGYDSIGPLRTVTGIVWQGDVSSNWSNYFSIYSPTVNFNHADCNGDGIINADDTLAIMTNYGLTHAKTANMPGPWRSGIPGLTIQMMQDTLFNGSAFTSNIYLGDSLTSVNNIYGLAFTFNYDPLVIDSNYSKFSFVSSWLGNPTNSININRNFTTGQVEAAITGIDHTSRSGSGLIATFVGEITTSNINGKTYSYYDNINYISNVTAIDQYGNPIALNAGIDSDYVGFFVNGIKPVASPMVSIYPNPAATQVRVSADVVISGVTITDLLGETVQTISTNNTKSTMIDISKLSDGVYIVHVSAIGGTTTAKLVVSR